MGTYNQPYFNPTQDIVWTDSLAAVFGTGSDAKIYYDGTNWLFQPAVVGTGMAQFQRSAIGATPADVIGIYNLTDAAAGAQQYSGAFRWHGEGWKTDAAAASQNVDARMYLIPVQGAANPTANLVLDFSINDAAFATKVWFNSDGGVGLGAAPGVSPLDVQAAADPYMRCYATGANSTARVVVQNDARQWVILVDGALASDAYKVRDGTASADRFVIDNLGNVSFGGVLAWGTSAQKVLAMGSGTAPTTGPADAGQIWVEDVNGAAGYAGPHMMVETNAKKLVVVGAYIKTDTGQVANPYEGLMEINTFDNTLKVYADGGWRSIATAW